MTYTKHEFTSTTFNCPLAGFKVTLQLKYIIKSLDRDFTNPIKIETVDECSGLDNCGVKTNTSQHNYTFNWDLCPYKTKNYV